MIINHNIASMNTYRQLSTNNVLQNKSLEKLSSGLRINRAGDDAAGLAISEKMRGQIRGLDQASRNAQDSISLIQTAEGALNETHSILQRMRELAVQAANDTNTSADRNEIQKEVSQLTSEIDRIANTTQFNTKVLLKGAYGTSAVSADTTNFAILSSKADTVSAGTYAVNVSAAATKTTYSSADVVDLAGTPVTVDDSNNTLNINGVSITFNDGDTSDASVISQINAYSAETGVIASSDSGGGVTLTSANYGAHGITVSGTAEDWIFGAQTYALGQNAVIDTVGGTAVTVSADATDGRILTINSGALKGMQVQAGAAASYDVTVTKNSLTMQIGANEGQTFAMSIEDMGATSIGVSDIDVTTATAAGNAITTIQTAIDAVSAERSKLGAIQNRLEHTINNLGTSSENLSAAESRVRDVDMAKEMMQFTKMNILSQAATAMLAQANSQPQNVLQLLR